MSKDGTRLAPFPGPVFGVIIGLSLLLLGVAHGVRTARPGDVLFERTPAGPGDDQR